MHLQRGYWEDSTDTAKPGSIFELSLPIIRTAEVILHAVRLANIMTNASAHTEIQLNIQYTGLAGRKLTSMDSTLFDNRICRQNSVELSTQFKAADIQLHTGTADNLAPLLCQLLQPLYSLFDFFKLNEQLVASRIAQMVGK